MNRQKEKRVSLKTKTFRVILLVSLALIMAGSAAGLLLYTFSSLKNFKSEAKHLIEYSMSMQDSGYIEKNSGKRATCTDQCRKTSERTLNQMNLSRPLLRLSMMIS